MSTFSATSLWPCQRGEVMAQQAPCQAYMKLFRSLISAPPDTYRELYLATLYRFMELCQALPDWDSSKPSAVLEPYSLIQRAFALAVAALQSRRGRMMPPHSNSEQIAEQEARWTYALLTTALFRAIPADWQTAYTVGLYKNEQGYLGLWHPLTGSLYEPNTFYRLEEKPLPHIVDASLLKIAWVGRLIPAVALRWLADKPPVFPLWWEAITQSSISPESNLLIQEITGVAQKLSIVLAEPVTLIIQPAPATTMTTTPLTPEITPADAKPIASPTPAPVSASVRAPMISAPPSPSKQALTRLNQWLDARSSNPEDRPFMRVKSGLLIYEDALHRMMAQYTQYASLEALITLLTEFLIPEKNSLRVRYRRLRVESREVRQGVILAEPYLKEWLKELPLCTDFSLDYLSIT